MAATRGTSADTAGNDGNIRILLKRFPAVARNPTRLVLKEIDIRFRAGEFLTVLGPSGCGKTTMLNIVAGLDADYNGQIQLPRVPGHAQPVLGYMFQNPRLLPWLTVRQNVHLVLDGRPERLAAADELLRTMGLTEFMDAHPTRISVGMSRRVALARAFAVEPDMLLMDEPFVSLDEPTAARLRRLLLDTWRAHRTSVLFVTHDLREAIQLADRIIFLSRPPSSVMAEVVVNIPRSQRGDEQQIETFRLHLLQTQGHLFQDQH